MTLKYLMVMFIVVLWAKATNGQHIVTLNEVIEMARSQSPQYRLEQTRNEVGYYQYLRYKSDLRPQINFYGQAPAYTKQYAAITQPDGTILYLPGRQSIGNAGFSLSQQIPLTGGTVSINTGLSRFDDLRQKNHQYNATPVFFRFTQPLFGFNNLKWSTKIEPLKLEESRKAFSFSMERIAQEVAGLYFDVLDAQENRKMSATDLMHTQENYEIEKKRIVLGTTTEDRLLQLELQLLTNSQNLEKARYNYQMALLSLKAALGSREQAELALTIPLSIPNFEVSVEQAIASARRNRPEFVAFVRKRLEAERDVASAKTANQQISVNATYGLNKAGASLGTSYSDPNDQQAFSIGFNIPVIDWGRRRAAYNTARANQRLTAYNNEVDETNYLQEITTLVSSLPVLRSNLAVTGRRDTVAQKRYRITNKLYQEGKLTVNDLNIAQNEKDNAQREYIAALRSLWNAWYLLRKVTLFDFEKGASLY